jgi:RNA polymerase sigma factor (sigma-70 family)
VWVVSDDALLDGLATGDPDAAAAFIERFQRRVFGVALRIVNDQRLAEDVAQETFLRAWQRASAFDPRRGTVVAWLLTIARNLAIDTVRLRRIVIVEPSEILARSDPVGDRGPDDLALLSSDTERLRRAMADLPPEQARALVLAAFFGRTAREISESESIPLGTAKTRIRTALLRLRAALVDDSEESG